MKRDPSGEIVELVCGCDGDGGGGDVLELVWLVVVVGGGGSGLLVEEEGMEAVSVPTAENDVAEATDDAEDGICPISMF